MAAKGFPAARSDCTKREEPTKPWLAMLLLELNVTTLLSPVQSFPPRRTTSLGACSTPPWAGTSRLLLRLLWGLGTPQDAEGLSNGCARTGSSALGHSWWDNTQSWGNLIFPPSLGPCSPMANPVQPVTTLADLCPHATSWGQAGHSSGMAREELPTLALVLGESSS